jgi:hypothetical protein
MHPAPHTEYALAQIEAFSIATECPYGACMKFDRFEQFQSRSSMPQASSASAEMMSMTASLENGIDRTTFAAPPRTRVVRTAH